MTLDQITSEIRNRAVAKGGIPGKIVKFHFGDDGVIRIDGKASPVTVDNEDTPADCTVKVALPDFLEMSAGRLNPTAAFMGGKLKIDGDMGIAMQLGSLLG